MNDAGIAFKLGILQAALRDIHEVDTGSSWGAPPTHKKRSL